ncbi:hypothetical protein FO519_000091 [Halicephalobus sp. NKZ332]|nr:hypothetical protein FO519_000091 [Halicephalobus sp. NKZ332]
MSHQKFLHFDDRSYYHFVYDENLPSTESDSYCTARDRSQDSPSSVKSTNSNSTSTTSDEIDKQLYSIVNTCDVLSDNIKKITSKPKKKEFGCQVEESTVNPLVMEQLSQLRHRNEDLQHGMEHYKEKCEQQKREMARMNLKLAENEEVVEELINFFNTKLDDLKTEFTRKAKSLIYPESSKNHQESLSIKKNPEIATLKTELEFMEGDNRRLRAELNQTRSVDLENSFVKAQIDSRLRERDQKWRRGLYDWLHGLKRTGSLRRRSAQ